MHALFYLILLQPCELSVIINLDFRADTYIFKEARWYTWGYSLQQNKNLNSDVSDLKDLTTEPDTMFIACLGKRRL